MVSMTTTERQTLRAAAMAALLCLTGQAAAQAPEEPQAETPAPGQVPGAEAMDAEEVPAPERRIDIWEYQVEGNNVLAPADIEEAVTPFLGPQRTVGDVQLARQVLEKAYKKKGYETVGVEIPDQDVRDGVVRLNVVELRVGRLRVTGSRYYSPERIRGEVSSLAEGEVPRYDAVTRDIAEVNQSRDRTITPTLRAGMAPGTVDVDLEVEDQLPLHGSLEVNDRYTTRTRRLRAVGSVSYANLFQRDHSLSVQTQFAPQDLDQTFLLSASYLAPFPRHDFSLVVYGVHSKSDVAAVEGINVLGSGDIVGVRGVWNFMGEKAIHTILAGADYKSFKEDLVLGNDTDSTPIDYLPLTVEYSLNHAGESGDTEFRSSLNGQLRGLGADDLEFGRKRALARANYVYSRIDLTRNQKLPRDFRLTASASGQAAGGPLISNEGFSIGGWDSVRGYLESQEVGDSGVNASLQLETPSLAPLLGGWMQEARAFAFYDWGEIYLDDAIGVVSDFEDRHVTLYSAGLGLRLQAFKTLNLEAVLAAPLKKRDALAEDGKLTLDVDDRYRAQFRFWAEF